MKIVKLSNFLKENGCYEQFINNFDKEFNYELWKHQIDGCINYAFGWNKTTEGLVFWNDIDDKWRFIENIENDMLDFDFNKAKEPINNKIIYFYSVYLLDSNGDKLGSDSNFIELYETINDVSDYDKLLETLKTVYSTYSNILIISFNRV